MTHHATRGRSTNELGPTLHDNVCDSTTRVILLVGEKRSVLTKQHVAVFRHLAMKSSSIFKAHWTVTRKVSILCQTKLCKPTYASIHMFLSILSI